MGELQPGVQQAQEPLRQRHRVRPLARGAAVPGGDRGVGLRQRQLLRRVAAAERVHRHPGTPAGDVRRLLADGVGAEVQHHRHDDQAGGEDQDQGICCHFRCWKLENLARFR